MEDPVWPSYPPEPYNTENGPRNVVHCWATQSDDATVQPRWGKVGMQKIEDAGPLYPERMKTFDDEIVDSSKKFISKAKAEGKPFFLWMNPTRMHVYTHLSKKYQDLINPKTGYGLYEAGMAQLDDAVGEIQKKIEEEGLKENTIFIFTTDNGAEVFTWPDGGMTPFRGAKGTIWEGGFRVPAVVSWPGKIAPGTVENGIFSGLDWFPTLVAAAGNPHIAEQLREGKSLTGRDYKVHLDGYDQTSLLTGQGESARHEIFYFAEGMLGAVRLDDYKYVFIDQPQGWFGPKVKLDWPQLYNLRLDPLERAYFDQAPPQMMDWYGHNFWRFTFVQQEVAKAAQSFVEFPPMQKGASFNLDTVKEQIEKAIANKVGQ
jgi:arylsulfatase A-like enzyme